MTSLKSGILEQGYIIMINTAIYIAGGKHLLMDHAERVIAVNAMNRICKRIRSGNITEVVVRKVKTDFM